MTNVNAIEVMDQLFKFKIGEFVARRDVYESWKKSLAIGGSVALPKKVRLSRFDAPPATPPIYQITERLAQQCHGGVQLFYQYNHDSKDGALITTRLAEMQFVSMDEVDALLADYYVKSDDA